jgi:serine/threonine-protein kinase
MSPEQARGKNIDWRSDLWALGVIAFQCLTGRPPFESEALGELMGMIIYDPIPAITSRKPGLPGALEVWWGRAVARDRERRFQSAKELADAFGQAIETNKLMAVPSIPPRPPLPSFNDFDGVGAAPAHGSYPPPDASAQFNVPHPFGNKTPVEEPTGAPVSRTRRSVLPELSSLPKRQRMIVLSVGGALIAVLGFLVIASLRSSAPVGPVVAAARPSAAPTIQVIPDPSAKLQPPPIIFGPSSTVPLEQLEQEDSDKKKKSVPGAAGAPAARPVGAVRDYGI